MKQLISHEVIANRLPTRIGIPSLSFQPVAGTGCHQQPVIPIVVGHFFCLLFGEEVNVGWPKESSVPLNKAAIKEYEDATQP